MDIDLPPNCRVLFFINYSDNDYFRLNVTKENTNLQYIGSNEPVDIEPKTFFNYFRHLTGISFNSFVSKEIPSFKRLSDLKSLILRKLPIEEQSIGNSVFSGLTNLEYLQFTSSNFNGITDGGFEALKKLTHLNLNNNKISQIQNGTLDGLSKLKELRLEGNGLSSVSENAFTELIQLTFLSLDMNPGFPLESLLPIGNLQDLSIRHNGYVTLDPFVFQQMKKLRNLYLADLFICDCRLQWTSIVQQFGIQIDGAYCSEPYSALGESISNSQLYTSCPQTQSYQCFNKSNTCGANEMCNNIGDGYVCGCRRGYHFNGTSICKDIDECNTPTNCQHSCENTEGSFHCVCNVGYQLSVNGYNCEDINECKEGNRVCEYGCENTIGSYKCYCEVWQQLYNETQCSSGIYCELIGMSHTQTSANNELETHAFCKGGYNISIRNLTCPSIATTATTSEVTSNSQQLTSTSIQTTTITSNEITETTQSIKHISTVPTTITTESAVTTPTLSELTQPPIVQSQLNCEWSNSTIILFIILFVIIGILTLITITLLIYILLKKKKIQKVVKKPTMQQTPNEEDPQLKPVYQNINETRELESTIQLPKIEMVLLKSNQSTILSSMVFPESYPASSQEEVVYMNMK